MSRFRPRTSPSGAVLAPPRSAPPVPPAAPLPFNRTVQVPPTPVKFAEPPSGIMQRFGFWVLCAYLLSGILNGWTMRLMGMKGYVSTVALVALPLCWLISGSPFRGLRQSMGWWWAGFLAWMLLATPFSIWRGGSVALLVH